MALDRFLEPSQQLQRLRSMHPVFACGRNGVGVPAALNELLHARDRLLREHVEEQPDHGGEQDDGDCDRHCFGGGLGGPWTAGGGCPPLGGATAPGSTMNVRMFSGRPSYWN